MERVNQKVEYLLTNITLYKAIRSPKISVSVKDAEKVFSWLSIKIDSRAVSVGSQNLYIKNIQKQKGKTKTKIRIEKELLFMDAVPHAQIRYLEELAICSLIVSAIVAPNLLYKTLE